MKVRDFTAIERKLGMQTSESKHHHAWFVHEGVTVARTKRSHGDNKFIPEHLIRKQLYLDQAQFAGLQSCSVDKEAYVKILIDKGIIVPKRSEQPTMQAPPNPKSQSS
jgi:hypothetical protein